MNTSATASVSPYSTEALRLKCSTPPSTYSRDRINPSYLHSALYTDEGLWENRIGRIRDVSKVVQENLSKTESSTPYPSLDALCEKELERRHPTGLRIRGISGFIERCTNAVFRVFGSSYCGFTEAARQKYKKQIAYSAMNRSDLRSTIKIEDPELKRALNMGDEDALVTTHVFSKNSPMNGSSYFNEKGEKVLISQAITSSSDRKAERINNLRRVVTKEGKSIAYAGRVDTEEKAFEQASFLFLSELRAQKQGITQSQSESGETLYEICYIVNSLLTTNPAMAAEIPGIVSFPEAESFQNEKAALHSLAGKGYLEITDPEDGKTYKVQFRPILFSEVANFFQKTESTIPPELSNSGINSEVNHEGFVALSLLVQQKYTALHKQKASAEDPSTINKQIAALAGTWELCLSSTSLPEERLLARDYLCKLLDLPIVYHCKSNIDRTGILIAISSALQQWIDLGLEVPTPVTSLLLDIRFKELFAANFLTGHQITGYARSFEGPVNGKMGCPHNIGYSLSRGLTQNPLIHRLMPERYLTPYAWQKKALATLALFTGHILALPVFAAYTLWKLGHFLVSGCQKEHLPDWRYTFPFGLGTLLIRSMDWIPEKILNESSPQVGERRLISKSKGSCPEFASSCLQKSGTSLPDPARFKRASTPKEYQAAVEHFKRDVKVAYSETSLQISSSVRDMFAEIYEKRRKDPSYDCNEDLSTVRNTVLGTLQRDLARTSIYSKSRALIIDGKRYGFDPKTELDQKDEIGFKQTQEIYFKVKDFYVKTTPSLALKENEIELEEKVLRVIDQIHQGGLAPLQQVVQEQFAANNFLPTSNNCYHIELRLDPDEILEDNAHGSILLMRRLIMEIATTETLEKRAVAIPPPQACNEYGLTIYKDDLKGEACLFVESKGEINHTQALPVRFGFL